MSYIDLRPYKPRVKKSKTESEAPVERPKTSFNQADAGYVMFGSDGSGASEVGGSIVPEPPEQAAGDFFSSFAEVGRQEGSIAVEKKDTIELLNALHDRIRQMEEQLHRIERKLEGREGRKYFGGD